MVLFLGLIIKIPWIFGDHKALMREQDGFLYDRFLQFISPAVTVFPSLVSVLAFGILFLHAYFLTGFINNQRLVNRPNYLPGMAFMLVSSFIPEFNYLSAPLIVSLCFLLVFTLIFRSYHHQRAKGFIFNSGLIAGVATMFFHPAVFFILWCIAALAIIRPFRLNEQLLLLLGCITPYYFFLVYLFLSGQWEGVYQIIEPIYFGVKNDQKSLWFAGALFLTILPLLAGVYYVNALGAKMLIQIRKGWILMGLYFIIAVVIALINPGNDLTNWVLILVPVAALHAFGYLNSEVKLYPLITFWLTVAFIWGFQLAGRSAEL